LTKQPQDIDLAPRPTQDAGAPEITLAMTKAGAIALELYSESYHLEMLAAAVYTAMRRAAVEPPRQVAVLGRTECNPADIFRLP
jgi:hypothetical protein